MITAQDIREKTFEKTRIGGYDMESVDDFMDELADEITASQKENAVLKSKMKVLVDKIEEYRANEEALNLAVLSAQKLAVQIENDARTRSASMLEEADRQVKARVGGIEEETARQEKRLAEAKASTEKFFTAVRAMCNKQLENIDAISAGMLDGKKAEAPAETPVEDAAVDKTVRSIEESVSRIQPEPDVKMDLSKEMRAPARPKRNLDSTQPFTL
ncbi:MAG: DivIVA domain-containing protein [Candidatus Limivicinus sp.]|jgi:cell division initiation protein